MQEVESLEVLDGVMLSDAGIYYSHTGHGEHKTYFDKAYLHINLSGEEHIDWLKVIQSALECIGAGFTRIRTGQSMSKGKPYIKCELWTKAEPLWVPYREKWYRDGKKIVPKGLSLTPRSLAHWYTGDGEGDSKGFSFAVCKFTVSEAGSLQTLLQGLGIRASVGGSLPLRLVGSGANNVDKFMNTISPYIVPSFMYKLRKSEIPVELRRV